MKEIKQHWLKICIVIILLVISIFTVFHFNFFSSINIDQLLTVWSVLGPIVFFIFGRWWHISDLKQKTDIEIFRKFDEILPHETYRQFVDDTWNMQYSTYLNKYLDEYNQMAESPTNNYNNKQLNLKHLKFVKAVKTLLMSVSINFGFPGTQQDIMNLQSVASHETERYGKVFSEVRILNNEMCSYYEDYIKTVKKKLFI